MVLGYSRKPEEKGLGRDDISIDNKKLEILKAFFLEYKDAFA